jgi:hypothetical protein
LKAEDYREEWGNPCIPFVYKSKNGAIYYNQINRLVNDLELGDGEAYTTISKGRKLELLDFVVTGIYRLLILKDTSELLNPKFVYRHFDRRWYRGIDDCVFHNITGTQKVNSYAGSVHDGSTSVIFSNGNGVFAQFDLKPSLGTSGVNIVDNCNEFDYYLGAVYGITLASISAPSGTNYGSFKSLLLSVPSSGFTAEETKEYLEHFYKQTSENKDEAIANDWKLAEFEIATKLAGPFNPNQDVDWYGFYHILSALCSANASNLNLKVVERGNINGGEVSNANYQLPNLPSFGKIAHTTGYSQTKHHVINSRGGVFVYDYAVNLSINPSTRALAISAQTMRKELSPSFHDISITHDETVASNSAKRFIIAGNYAQMGNLNMGNYFKDYLIESYYSYPLFAARNLIKNGYYKEALGWLTSLYDFRKEDETKRSIYQGLQLDDSPSVTELNRNFDSWLLDPLDPHKLGRTRKNAYLKFTVRTIVECLLQYADANFTIDTVESNSKAAELYEQAIVLLNSSIFNSLPAACSVLTDETVEEIICLLPAGNKTDVEQLRPAIKGLVDRLGTTALAETALATLKDDMTFDVGEVTFDFYGNVTTAINNLKATGDGQPEVPSLADINDHKGDTKETYTWSSSSTAESDAIVERATLRAQQSLIRSLSQITGKSETELEESPEDLGWLNKSLKEEKLDNPEAIYKEGSPLAPASSDQALMFYETWPNTSQVQMSEYAIPYIPILNQDFCVPANPVYNSLQLWAALNLFKLRNCMNIAGMKRQVDVYAAPTDATSGIPYIGANGQIVLPGSVRIAPTQYRYQYIIQRAKELVSLAQQLEANLLSLLEKKDSESYSMMKAKQDMALARANVKLQDLRIKVSEGEVDLAVLQKERSELQVDKLQELISKGLNGHEERMIASYYGIAALEATLLALSFQKEAASDLGSIIIGVATNAQSAATAAAVKAMLNSIYFGASFTKFALQANINASSIYAAQERREDEWKLQQALGEQDIKIGQQSIRVAKDRLRVTGQERQISGLQLSHAEDTVNFLNNKFTNVELYSWMSGVIEGVYAYFLRQATATAKMAQNQLAFERQELPAPFIQDDYWQSPADSAGLSALGDGSSTVDRRGLTGSARLLQDIYKVDQFAFESDKRKLQLAKTFSLSRIATIEFQRFRETGEITFETMMENFDRDFPGHYLRLIKKVNVSVIALVPPVDGIKATLTSSGISHVVTKGDTYQDTIVRRDPEIIAFTGTQGATGLFELQTDDRFTNPFEGSGVHTRWQLQLPTDTNLFNFDTIADVLITIEYTALHSFDYQQQVLRKLDPEYAAERAISFREELPDQFYELNNPDESDTPMQVNYDISSFDFPAGVKDLYIKSIKIYYVVDDDQRAFFESQSSALKTYLQLTGGSVNTGEVDATPGKSGLISTESGNGGGYLALIGKQPQGKWTYKLPNDNLVKKLFADEVIRDVIFIIGFGGTVKPRVNP